MKRFASNKQKRLLLTGAVILGAWIAQQAGLELSSLLDGSGNHSASQTSVQSQGERISQAILDRESGVMVTVEAEVRKLLPDDREGSRHQRFLIELGGGQTILVAHNIDLAARIDVERGSRVRIRGQYEWNERGGVLHWTHHDPAGRHPGGWIESGGRRVE